MSDNGKDKLKDKPEAKPEPKKVQTILMLGKTEDGKIMVQGMLTDKKLCVFALAEALKAVMNYEESKIIKPNTQPKFFKMFKGTLNFPKSSHP